MKCDTCGHFGGHGPVCPLGFIDGVDRDGERCPTCNNQYCSCVAKLRGELRDLRSQLAAANARADALAKADEESFDCFAAIARALGEPSFRLADLPGKVAAERTARELAEANCAAMQTAMCMDQPYSLPSVFEHLIKAGVALFALNYDGHGWEVLQSALTVAPARLEGLRAAVATDASNTVLARLRDAEAKVERYERALEKIAVQPKEGQGNSLAHLLTFREVIELARAALLPAPAAHVSSHDNEHDAPPRRRRVRTLSMRLVSLIAFAAAPMVAPARVMTRPPPPPTRSRPMCDWSGHESEWLQTWPGQWNRYRGERDCPTNTATITLERGRYAWIVRATEPWKCGLADTWDEASKQVDEVLAGLSPDLRAELAASRARESALVKSLQGILRDLPEGLATWAEAWDAFAHVKVQVADALAAHAAERDK